MLGRDLEGWFGDSFVKCMAAFCPCQKSLPEAKVESFGLIPLVEETSKQCNLDTVGWLLVLTLMKIYNEKEQASK